MNTKNNKRRCSSTAIGMIGETFQCQLEGEHREHTYENENITVRWEDEGGVGMTLKGTQILQNI